MRRSHAILYLDTTIKNCVNKVDHEQPAAKVSNGNYLGGMLTVYLSCAKNVEQVKIAFFKQSNSIYYKFNFSDKNLLSHFSTYT